MQIQFLGGARTVTGSQHLLTVNGAKVLIECGLFQGRRQDTYERNMNFAYDPKDIDVMILSHAHIDHSGNIPNLYRQGFRGHIFATNATVDLCQIMLRDSAYLNEKDVEWVNKVRLAQHKEPIEPLYTIEDAEQALKLFVGVQYGRLCRVAKGVNVTFQDAGHILGSACVRLDIEENGRNFRLGFSGDVGNRPVPILRDPDPLRDIDALIMESTYGDREHADSSHTEEELADLIQHVVARGGNLIIPSFAVGRTQHLVYTLHLLLERNRIPRIPIFVDSPMACNAMDVFRSHPECFDRETYAHFMNDDQDPFQPEGFACVRTVEASKRINELAEPKIIIAASGMMEGGRVLHHLRNNIEDKRTMLLFVGFAAEHTLARRLMDGAKTAKIFGEEYPVKCEVKVMTQFSAHADRSDLLAFLKATPPSRLKTVFLVHGEESQAMSLRSLIIENGYETVYVPAQGESHNL